MSFPLQIEELTAVALRLDEAGFVRAFPAPALLVGASTDAGDELDSFRTLGHERREALSLAAATAHARAADAGGAERRVIACFVAKSGRNPFSQMITVGRAENNDIVLRHQAVSKLHAHIQKAGEVWTIEDHSTNGTFVDGIRLATGLGRALDEGQVLRFSPSVHARFHTPVGLHRVLLAGAASEIGRIGSGAVRLPSRLSG